MEFAAIDVETANYDISSICQIGIAIYKKGELTAEWCSLINPEDYFHPINVSIHGITERDVADSPTIAQVHDKLCSFLDNTITICHTHFDRSSICKSCKNHELREPVAIWLDSARVARRAWEEVSWSGYGLKNVCKILGYNFKHHDAMEDAKAAGHIILAASAKTGLSVEDWLTRVNQPIDPNNVGEGKALCREGNFEGELFGETLVFTGALKIKRKDAADLAASIGCKVIPGVTKKTTMLVVGDQDITKLAKGKDKSSKQLKAEKLISAGQQIRILGESDFKDLVAQARHIKTVTEE